ncbi:MAG: zinc ABC transporter solute-binding protein [Desulfuromonadaceae bacterium]|nr:zinc ABC transporter solute-binding protein [Desulfuromonadaceae bacterium]
MRRQVFLANLFVGFLILCLAPAATLAGNDPLPVFVSVLPQKQFVERIGGERVQVSVMVPPGRSPATYEPTPRQMAGLSRARLYFSIGVPFERIWMKRVAANNPQMKVIDSQCGIELMPMNSYHHHHEGEIHSPSAGGHETGPPDPHIWTSPALVKIMADNIVQALCEASPENIGEFQINYQKFVTDLDLLEKEIRVKLAPLSNRRFLVFHPSWGYFARDFGLEQIAIESGGKEPGAKTLAALIERAKQEEIRVIFVQEQFSRTAAATVAAAIGGRVVAIDPLAEDYFANLRRVAEVLAAAMRQP